MVQHSIAGQPSFLPSVLPWLANLEVAPKSCTCNTWVQLVLKIFCRTTQEGKSNKTHSSLPKMLKQLLDVTFDIANPYAPYAPVNKHRSAHNFPCAKRAGALPRLTICWRRSPALKVEKEARFPLPLSPASPRPRHGWPPSH